MGLATFFYHDNQSPVSPLSALRKSLTFFALPFSFTAQLVYAPLCAALFPPSGTAGNLRHHEGSHLGTSKKRNGENTKTKEPKKRNISASNCPTTPCTSCQEGTS